MKKASIIALIVAVVILLSGLICCVVGSSDAKKEGFMLFPQTENGESVYTYDFTEREINRITIDATSAAKITLTRGGERSYIEIRNYNANYYRLNEENRAISFAEIDDVLSMFKFWEGFTFKGMRYVFASGVDRNEAHSITVNLSESESVGSIMLRPKAGEITVDGFKGECDLTLSVGEGKIAVSSVSVGGSFVATASTGELVVDSLNALNVNLSSDDAEVSAKGVKCEKFTWSGAKRTFFADGVDASDLSATATEASVTVTGATFKTAKIETQSGPVRVDLPLPLSSYAADVTTQTGSIFLNGEKYEGSQYKTIPEKTPQSAETEAADTDEGGEDAQNGEDAESVETEAAPETNKPDEQKHVTVQIRTANGSIDLSGAPEPESAEAPVEG